MGGEQVSSFRTSIETSMSGDLMAELTESQLFELRDAFKLYEEQSDEGKVDLQELGRLLRSLGLDLTERELDQSMKELSADGVNTLEFPDFIKMLYKRIKQKDTDDELRAAFKELDEENIGRVKASELRRLLVEMVGEQSEEVDAMLKEAKVDR